MTPPRHGFYSKYFTPEEIEKLDTIPTDQFLADVRRWLLSMAVDLLRDPGLGRTPGGSRLSGRDRLRLIKLIITLTRSTKP